MSSGLQTGLQRMETIVKLAVIRIKQIASDDPATIVPRPEQALRTVRQVTRDSVAHDFGTSEQGPQMCEAKGDGAVGTLDLPGP